MSHNVLSQNNCTFSRGRFGKYAIRSSKDCTSQPLFYIKVHREWGKL